MVVIQATLALVALYGLLWLLSPRVHGYRAVGAHPETELAPDWTAYKCRHCEAVSDLDRQELKTLSKHEARCDKGRRVGLRGWLRGKLVGFNCIA